MRKSIFILLLVLVLGCAGCGKSEMDIRVEEPIIMGAGYFGNYVLLLRLYEGEYESDYSVGPGFGPNWSGEYELVVMESGSDSVLSRYQLTEWDETLCFQENFDLQVTDLNADGCMEVLIGQYGASNFNLYRMYYIDADLQIGYYSKIGELTISSQEMSPCLEVSGNSAVYSVYDNAKGEWVTGEIDITALALQEY
ncbi:MAG: hypothetical protein LUE16_10930 [Lachnospiraceae bacterium]|nr:hypothetical protein [Lachnospiraceae bacterium]